MAEKTTLLKDALIGAAKLAVTMFVVTVGASVAFFGLALVGGLAFGAMPLGALCYAGVGALAWKPLSRNFKRMVGSTKSLLQQIDPEAYGTPEQKRAAHIEKERIHIEKAREKGYDPEAVPFEGRGKDHFKFWGYLGAAAGLLAVGVPVAGLVGGGGWMGAACSAAVVFGTYKACFPGIKRYGKNMLMGRGPFNPKHYGSSEYREAPNRPAARVYGQSPLHSKPVQRGPASVPGTTPAVSQTPKSAYEVKTRDINVNGSQYHVRVGRGDR